MRKLPEVELVPPKSRSGVDPTITYVVRSPAVVLGRTHTNNVVGLWILSTKYLSTGITAFSYKLHVKKDLNI